MTTAFQMPCALNTMILQLEEKSSAGWNGNVNPATFYWVVWVERIIAFRRAAYCMCFSSRSALDTAHVRVSFMEWVYVHLLSALMISCTRWLPCHTHTNWSFLWPKMPHWTSHRAPHFTDWLFNSDVVNHFYQIFSPCKRTQLQRTIASRGLVMI